jgi:UDPglucose 6-dehydrogenase
VISIYDPQVEHAQIWTDLAEAIPATPLDSSAHSYLLCYFCLFTALPPLLTLPVKEQVTICASAMEACKDAEAVVIATEWKEFKEIDWTKVYARMKKPAFVFDGRLIVDTEKLRQIGFKVSCVRVVRIWLTRVFCTTDRSLPLGAVRSKSTTKAIP